MHVSAQSEVEDGEMNEDIDESMQENVKTDTTQHTDNNIEKENTDDNKIEKENVITEKQTNYNADEDDKIKTVGPVNEETVDEKAKSEEVNNNIEQPIHINRVKVVQDNISGNKHSSFSEDQSTNRDDEKTVADITKEVEKRIIEKGILKQEADKERFETNSDETEKDLFAGENLNAVNSDSDDITDKEILTDEIVHEKLPPESLVDEGNSGPQATDDSVSSDNEEMNTEEKEKLVHSEEHEVLPSSFQREKEESLQMNVDSSTKSDSDDIDAELLLPKTPVDAEIKAGEPSDSVEIPAKSTETVATEGEPSIQFSTVNAEQSATENPVEPEEVVKPVTPSARI